MLRAPSPQVWFQQITGALRASLQSNRGLALAFLEAVVHAPRDEKLRESLAESYREDRDGIVSLLGLGDDEIGRGLASSLVATFHGLLILWLIDPQAVPGDEELLAGLDRLGALLAKSRAES